MYIILMRRYTILYTRATMNALAFILTACIFALVSATSGDYVVQVSGICDAACLTKLAAEAGPGCTAESLGSSLDKTWVKGTCPSTGTMTMTSASAGTGWASLAKRKFRGASGGFGVQSVEEDGEYTVNDLWGVDEVDGSPKNGERCLKSRLGLGILIAVLDTGCTPRVTKTDYFSAIKCRSYIHGEDTNSCTDRHSHGTHVAGIAGGGIYGVAPKADVACLKVLGDKGGGTLSGIIKAVNDVAAFSRASKKRVVLNMSLGGGKSPSLNSACLGATKKSRVMMVVAAGNSGRDYKYYSPASSANSRRIFAIGAHDKNGNKASWSNYGKRVQISAPGVSILSTIPGGTSIKSGTSMAAPHVAGAMAAVWSDRKWPNLSRLTKTENVTYPNNVKVKKATYLCAQ